MLQDVRMFTEHGDTVVAQYDTTTDMKQVNQFIDSLEKSVGGRAFSLATGEAVETVTPDTRDVFILRPIAGG